jgi:predicted transglutaminase-like cysteine proteinase
MADQVTNNFWGLPRRLPRFADLPAVSPFEGLGVGAILGTLLVTAAYIAQDIWFEQLQQWRPFTSADYLRVFAWLFGVPLMFGIALYAALRFTAPKPELSDEIPLRRLRSLVALLREHHRLFILDWLLIALAVGLAACAAGVFKIDLREHWRDWPIGVAAVTTLLLVRCFRRNPFVPVVRPVAVPPWVDELIAQTSDLPADDPGNAARRAFCRQHGVVDRDDCTDPACYFRYPLSAELPAEICDLAIQCGPGVKERLAEFLSEHGGAYYQTDKYQGSLRMIDLQTGPLDGTGLLEMKRLIAQILTRARHARWSRWQLAEVILHFVQRVIRYAEDQPTTGHSEYGRFPLQTLLDGHGDCECTTLLCCALLSHLGYESALVLTESTNGSGHALAALRPPPDLPAFYTAAAAPLTAEVWLFGETTLDDEVLPWLPQHPPGVAKVERIVPIPALAL